MGRGGLGVAALLGPQAVPCALLELYGCKQSKKRSLEEGKTMCNTYMQCKHTCLQQHTQYSAAVVVQQILFPGTVFASST